MNDIVFASQTSGMNLVPAELASGPFETQTRYSQIALGVTPRGAIADMVCPRIRAPFKFTYTKLTETDLFTVPATRASRAARVNEVEFGATDVNDSVEDYALATPVPYRDINESSSQGSPYDPLEVATMGLSKLMMLDREIRVANLVFADGSYPTGHKVTLSGASQWSDSQSNPLDAILAAMDKPLIRPNTIVFGQKTWTKFRQHAKIVEAITMSGAGTNAQGAVSRQAVADLLEVDNVYVGGAQYNTAKRGQAASYSYVWGPHAALLYIDPSASVMMDAEPTFCFTAEAMARYMGTYDEPSRGTGMGSRIVKVSECIKEVVSWNAAGYFWKAAVA